MLRIAIHHVNGVHSDLLVMEKYTIFVSYSERPQSIHERQTCCIVGSMHV